MHTAFVFVFGFSLRFVCFFFPFVQVMWLTICTAVVGYVPKGEFKRWLNKRVSIMCFQVLSSALSSVITYHNVTNRPKSGICVANHTSPIDCLVLACDNCYSLVGIFTFVYILLTNFFFTRIWNSITVMHVLLSAWLILLLTLVKYQE